VNSQTPARGLDSEGNRDVQSIGQLSSQSVYIVADSSN
jgi:hypothetical protein